MKNRLFVLLMLGVLIQIADLRAESAAPPYVPQITSKINRIHIDALDAFDPKIPEYRSWLFRFLNKLHNRTNDSFIQRELLLQEGDFLDSELLAETERNLRRHKFLDNVRLDTKIVGPGLVDLYVHTEDQWTTQLDISAKKSSGSTEFQMSIEESNFLGFGKTLGIAFERKPDRDTYDFGYYDPQFFNTRWNFEAAYQDASDGWRWITDIVKPFYALDTKWAYGLSIDSGASVERLYHDTKKAVEIDTDRQNGIFFAARAWGDRYNKKRFGVLLSADNLLYPNPARIILPEAAKVKAIQKNLHPIDRESYQYGAIFKWDRRQYIEETYLDNFGRIEDLPVGVQLGAVFARAEEVSTARDFYQFHTIAQYNLQLNSFQYAALQGNLSMRREVNGTINNVIFNGYAHYYLQMPELRIGNLIFPRQTFAANLSSTLTHNVDAPFQISLGEDEGLRGYKFKSFTGHNRLLLNLEDRIFSNFNYRLFGIGLVAFMDAGYVWSSDEHLRFKDFGLSTGIGLRIGLKKAQSARVVRIDFAVPLQKGRSPFNRTDPKGYSISVSSGHVFTVLEKLPRLFQLF